MGAMPDSYGSSLTFDFFFGPKSSPRPIAIAAIRVASAIITAMAMYSSNIDTSKKVRLDAQVVQTCTLATKYIISVFGGLDNVSHFTKMDDIGHNEKDRKSDRCSIAFCSTKIIFQGAAPRGMP